MCPTYSVMHSPTSWQSRSLSLSLALSLSLSLSQLPWWLLLGSTAQVRLVGGMPESAAACMCVCVCVCVCVCSFIPVSRSMQLSYQTAQCRSKARNMCLSCADHLCVMARLRWTWLDETVHRGWGWGVLPAPFTVVCPV